MTPPTPPPHPLSPVCGFFLQAIHSVAWHHEGKQFICSHSDGTLTIWNVRGQGKPVQTITPHGKARARQTRHGAKAADGELFCLVSGLLSLQLGSVAVCTSFTRRRCGGGAESALLMMPVFIRAPLPPEDGPHLAEASTGRGAGCQTEGAQRNKGRNQSKDGLLTCVSSCCGVRGEF